MKVKEVERFEGLVSVEGGFVKTKIVRCTHVIRMSCSGRKSGGRTEKRGGKRGIGGAVGCLVGSLRVCGVSHVGSQLSPSVIIVI